MDTSPLKRTFFAVDVIPGPALLDAVRCWRERLAGDRIRWTGLEKMHITLTFLGDTAAGQIEQAGRSLGEKLPRIRSFTIRLSGMGIFGKVPDPRVFWAGVEENSELLRIKNITDEVARNEGFVIDRRPFSPHITIARPKQINDPGQLRALIEQYRSVHFQESVIDKVIWYESILTGEGALYKAIRTYPLG